MFALIETNGASHIAIYVPHEGAEKTLPALAAMLERNATFIQQGYQELKTVQPAMSIVLGDTHRCENYGLELAIMPSRSVIDESFVLASPEVFVSNAKVLQKEKDESTRLRTENSFLKSEMERIKSEMASVVAANSDSAA